MNPASKSRKLITETKLFYLAGQMSVPLISSTNEPNGCFISISFFTDRLLVYSVPKFIFLPEPLHNETRLWIKSRSGPKKREHSTAVKASK